MEVTITAENFESLKNGELPLVVDFWATWCGPCRALGPVVSELAKEYDGKIVVGKCDVEENDDIAAAYGVMSVPTLLFFKNGEPVEKKVGALPKNKLKELFERACFKKLLKRLLSYKAAKNRDKGCKAAKK